MLLHIGKTTLIKLITGKYKPLRGVCRFNEHARAAFFTQHHVDQLNLEMSALQFLQSVHSDAKEYQIRGILGRYGFDAQLAGQKISTLSGGQKSRVAFALLTWKDPHLIIMDEPTNHLDIETIEALINAIKLFQGAVVVISHDTHFISQVATEYWAVSEQGELRTMFDLDDAKQFAYKPIQFNPDDISLKKIIQQKQQEKIDLKSNNNNNNNSNSNNNNNNKQFVRNKNKSKKGRGGIDILADERQRIANEQQASDAAQQANKLHDENTIESQQHNMQPSIQSDIQQHKNKSTNKQSNLAASFNLLSLDIEAGMDSDDERQQRKIKKKQAQLLAEAANIDAEAEAERKRIKKQKKKLKAMLQQNNDDDESNLVDVNDLPDGNGDRDGFSEKQTKKKHNKKVEFTKNDSIDNADIDIELDDSVSEKKKKKKKSSISKKLGHDSDDDNDGNQSEQKEISKKKKNKKTNELVSDNDDTQTSNKQFSNTRDSDDDQQLNNKKKKKSSKSKSKSIDNSDNDDQPIRSKKSKSKQSDTDDDNQVINDETIKKKKSSKPK